MITNLIKENKSIEIVENMIIFSEGMLVVFPGDKKPSTVGDCIFVVTKPSPDSQLGSIVQNVFLQDDEKK